MRVRNGIRRGRDQYGKRIGEGEEEMRRV